MDHKEINKRQMDQILRYIEEGKKDGATLLCGGNRIGDKGYFVENTVFTDVTDDMSISREEIFGPVMTVVKFKTVDEVIKRANDTPYGLSAGLVTNDINNIMKITNALKAGYMFVNSYHVFRENLPFGGFKQSGVGRENGQAGIHGYLEEKTVIIKRPNDSLP